MDNTLTIGDAAKKIGVCTKTIRSWLKAGKLDGYLVGGRYRFKPEDIDAFFKRARFEARRDIMEPEM